MGTPARDQPRTEQEHHGGRQPEHERNTTRSQPCEQLLVGWYGGGSTTGDGKKSQRGTLDGETTPEGGTTPGTAAKTANRGPQANEQQGDDNRGNDRGTTIPGLTPTTLRPTTRRQTPPPDDRRHGTRTEEER